MSTGMAKWLAAPERPATLRERERGRKRTPLNRDGGIGFRAAGVLDRAWLRPFAPDV